MDFIKILRSFEEFLFEATSWLVFYPLTLCRVVTRPLTWMAYSDAEQADETRGRYDRALSPPLMLLITIVLLNLIGAATHIPPPPDTAHLAKLVNSTPQNQALFRALSFSLLPLVAAIVMLRGRGAMVSRGNLRAPFYAQCYLAAPCAMIINAGAIIFSHDALPNAVGQAVALVGAAWFLATQTRWFAAGLGISLPKAALIALGSTLGAMVCLFVALIPFALL